MYKIGDKVAIPATENGMTIFVPAFITKINNDEGSLSYEVSFGKGKERGTYPPHSIHAGCLAGKTYVHGTFSEAAQILTST